MGRTKEKVSQPKLRRHIKVASARARLVERRTMEESDFLSCCGSTKFAKEMMAASPFSSLDQALQSANHIWFNNVRSDSLSPILTEQEKKYRYIKDWISFFVCFIVCRLIFMDGSKPSMLIRRSVTPLPLSGKPQQVQS